MTQHVGTVVRRTITVPVSQQRAFEVFTSQLGRWWPREYSIGQSPMADFILEPTIGGRWYEVGEDGKQCDTGRVTAFEPPARLALAWHQNSQFQFDPDPSARQRSRGAVCRGRADPDKGKGRTPRLRAARRRRECGARQRG